MLNRFLRVVVCVSFTIPGLSSAQQSDVTDSLQSLDSAQNVLAELESRYNINDPSLVEPLEQLANLYIELNEFEEAHVALDRATQITRMTEGLYSPRQLPLLQKKIDNYASRGDWDNVRNHSEHLLWLYREKTPVTPELVAHLMDLTGVYLRGVAEDQPLQQGYHLLQALESNRLALLVAQSIWGEYDPRTVPVLYQLLKQYHLQTIAVNRGGKTGYTLRELVPGSGWVFEKGLVRRTNHAIGVGILNQIGDVYAHIEPVDQEAIAMVDLYLADWEVLFTNREEAVVLYQEAYQGLLEAGVTRDQINEYLMTPEILPVDDFYPAVSVAMAERISLQQLPTYNVLANTGATMHFDEWSEAFPNVKSPVESGGSAELDSNFALFSFNLLGLNQVTRWMGGRYHSGIGVAEDAAIIQSQLRTPIPDEGLILKLHTLRFRPSLLNGEPAQSTGKLVYLMANQD